MAQLCFSLNCSKQRIVTSAWLLQRLSILSALIFESHVNTVFWTLLELIQSKRGLSSFFRHARLRLGLIYRGRDVHDDEASRQFRLAAIRPPSQQVRRYVQ